MKKRPTELTQAIAGFDIRAYLRNAKPGPRPVAASVPRASQPTAEDAWRRACPNRWAWCHTNDELVAKMRSDKLQRFALGDLSKATASVLICGKSSVGKSLACAVRLRRLLEARPRLHVVWLEAAEFSESIRRWPLGEGEPRALSMAKRAQLCVLDDLGTEGDAKAIVELVRHRYDHSARIWTTTGLNRGELEQRYGVALFRRLVETGGDGIAVEANE